MSFSSELKTEIISHPIKSSCCRKALLLGILSAKATAEAKTVTLSVENDEYAEFCVKLISEFFGRQPGVSTSKSGGRRRLISFESASAAAYIASIDSGKDFYTEKCQGCSGAFLRGVFFACGRVSDPQKQYHIEFSPVRRIFSFFELFHNCEIDVKSAIRRDCEIIYAKKSGVLEDFFAFIGVNSAAFALMNAKIEGELRNNANRVFNCDTNNIDKAVRASLKHISYISRLYEANLLSSLPEELEATARLRLAYKDYSLAQLAAISIPPISKSGLSHRLNKISEIAEKLLTKK